MVQENSRQKRRQFYYRGSLMSCNYRCSYCPFCKKSSSPQAEETDKKQLFRFIRRLLEWKDLKGAVQMVPYGEALIHPYYWEGLARLSGHSGIEAVGAQSNFSFPVEQMLRHYQSHGGAIEKLRLWGTFHPQMTSIENFLSQCEKLSKWKVRYCVGAVGVPEQIPDMQRLREKLDGSVYFWINKLDGLGRNYTQEEIKTFSAIDPYFELELRHYPADDSCCGNQIFVEADGSLRRCNLCRPAGRNLYDTMEGFDADLSCSRRECSCYLAYNNRFDTYLPFFQPYPAFRIPTYPRAVFLDIDGTIVPEGQKMLAEKMIQRIKKLAEHSRIYLATSLPVEDALRKVRGISGVLAGGVFASGGRCMIFQTESMRTGYDAIASLEPDWVEEVRKKQKKYGFHLLTYRKDDRIYKVTLTFPSKKFSDKAEREHFFRELVEKLAIPNSSCRCFFEDHCIEIVRRDRGKLEGIFEIMQEMGYQKNEVMAFGNSQEDAAMLEYFGNSAVE